jgi:hypothetical protein
VFVSVEISNYFPKLVPVGVLKTPHNFYIGSIFEVPNRLPELFLLAFTKFQKHFPCVLVPPPQGKKKVSKVSIFVFLKLANVFIMFPLTLSAPFRPLIKTKKLERSYRCSPCSPTRPQNLPQTTNKRGKACAMIHDPTT